ncbi:hypothetical protein DFS34DRAFT_647475 [Phlyctochytrium arcticum]|nr:hypothetical protein DFS34DRAFT_647475 [Phlyctochytrium arcticum]
MTDSQLEKLLDLQETFPPLHPGADGMYPALSGPIVALMPIFMRRYPQRIKKLVEETAVALHRDYAGGEHWKLSPHLFKLLSRPTIWTRDPDQAFELESILMRLLNFKNGRLLASSLGYAYYPAFNACLLKQARAPVIDRIIRAALDLCTDVPVNNKEETEKLWDANRNFLRFAIEALKHLVDRLLATSQRADRVYSFHSIFQPMVSSLLELIVKRGLQLARSFSGADDRIFIERVCRAVIDPLFGIRGDDYPYPPLLEQPFGWRDADTIFSALRRGPCSIYDIPNDGLEQPFFQTSTFSNEAIFTLMLAKFPPTTLPLFMDWCRREWALSLEEKQQIWRYMSHILPKLRLSNLSFARLSDLGRVAPTRRDMHNVAYELWQNQENSLGRYLCASFLDPTTDIGKDVLTQGMQGVTWQERLKGLRSLLAAVHHSGGVPEWIWAARLITTRLRNEIPCNKAAVVPFLCGENEHFEGVLDSEDYRRIPIQYLDMATRSEAEEFVPLYLDLQANNVSAQKKDESLDNFLSGLADQSLARFASDTSHPFFRFGMEMWRRKLRAQATPDEPVRFSTAEYRRYVRNENAERQRRVALQHAKRMAKEDGRWGMMSLLDGCEEQFVAGVLKLRQELFMPPESLSGDPEDSAEYLAQCKELMSALGLRWLRSATLLQVLRQLVDKLECAPTYDVGGGELVLDWRTAKWGEMEAVLAQIVESEHNFMEHHGLKFDWYDRYRELRLQSTLAIEEARFRRQCLLTQNKRQRGSEEEEKLVFELLAISVSAIHLDWVATYIVNFQTELLSCEYLAGKTIFGRFNPSGTHLIGRIVLPNPVTLLPARQCQTLAKR